MSKKIRKLTINDYSHVISMKTGIEDDYILPIFASLIEKPNVLYGLFLGEQLVSFAGYSIYANHYAMLGRLRSDLRYRGSGFATELMSHIIQESLQIDDIKWVGANTQEDNVEARRVLEKIGLSPYPKLYGAIAKNVSSLMSYGKPWKLIHDFHQKKKWLEKVYLENSIVFPYECYYLFPASNELLLDENIYRWSFYENESQTRFLITKPSEIGDLYLHTIYPWEDLTEQEGLWETILRDMQKLATGRDSETYVWIDLSRIAVESLPKNHPFELSSPWILYGKDK